MRRFIDFWWHCARTAVGGNSTFANDWQWVFGNPMVSVFSTAIISVVGALAPTLAARVGLSEMTTGHPVLDAFIGALGAFLMTWLVAFFVRLLNQPVVLFWEQKERADKLEGIEPNKILPKKDKALLELQKRYLSPISMQRGFLDHEADSLQAIADVQTIFNRLTARTNELTKQVERSNKRAASAKHAQEKRAAVRVLAGFIDQYSDQVVEFAALICGLTLVLQECTTEFIRRSNLQTKEDFDALDDFKIAVDGNVTNVQVCMIAASNTVDIFTKNFSGVTHDLTVAISRMNTVMGDLGMGLKGYITACEQIRALVERKAEDGKTQFQQRAV